jgi:hypothetical protein
LRSQEGSHRQNDYRDPSSSCLDIEYFRALLLLLLIMIASEHLWLRRPFNGAFWVLSWWRVVSRLLACCQTSFGFHSTSTAVTVYLARAQECKAIVPDRHRLHRRMNIELGQKLWSKIDLFAMVVMAWHLSIFASPDANGLHRVELGISPSNNSSARKVQSGEHFPSHFSYFMVGMTQYDIIIRHHVCADRKQPLENRKIWTTYLFSRF